VRPIACRYCALCSCLAGSAQEALAALRRQRTERRGVAERECCIDNLLVRIHLIIVMIRWTGLAP